MSGRVAVEIRAVRGFTFRTLFQDNSFPNREYQVNRKKDLGNASLASESQAWLGCPLYFARPRALHLEVLVQVGMSHGLCPLYYWLDRYIVQSLVFQILMLFQVRF